MRVKHLYKILISAAVPFLMGAILVLFSINTCQRFEPEGFLHITTDTIEYLTYGNYKVSGTVVDIGEGEITEHGFCWSETKSPTTNGPSSQLGPLNAAVRFKDTLSNLSSNTTYYTRAYVITNAGTEYSAEKRFTSVPSITDYDGNIYRIVTIGDQTWMAENLKVTHYSDGTAIPLVVDAVEWDAFTFTDRAYCWYDNDPSNGDIFGAQYVWAGATNNAGSSANPSSVQGACPSGWHLPSDSEWKQLEMHLGMSQADADGMEWRGTDEGGKLKESGEISWQSPNLGATNETGFTALPGGYRLNGNEFLGLSGVTYFYTATENDESSAWYRGLESAQSGIYRHNNARVDGFSVRCVEGGSTYSLPEVITSDVSGVTETSAQSGGDVTFDGGASITARGVCWRTSPGPTIEDEITNDGTGNGIFTSSITGLSQGTTYYVRAYATNSEDTAYGDELIVRTKTGSGSTVTDYDGNIYQTVQIGDQEWMAENLNVIHYPDGTVIQLVEDSTLWDALGVTDKAYCWYDDNSTNGDTYGALYTWGAAMNGAESSIASPSGVQGVCPDGMHLPGDTEWKELEMYLGMSQEEADKTGGRGTDEGGKLKEAGTFHWNSPNEGSNNESGFTALPAGSRSHDGSFSDFGNVANFWTTTEETFNPLIRKLFHDNSTVSRYTLVPYFGHSVRCVGN